MKAYASGTALALLMAAALGGCAASVATPPDFVGMLADTARPEADRVRDADRKPAELLQFAGVGAGDKVAELAPGGGYFTRLLSKAVGPTGKVYAMSSRPSAAAEAIAKTNPNVSFAVVPPGSVVVPEPVDIVWTSLNYHDFKNAKVDASDAAQATNAAAFRALKPGGTYLVVDHAAAAGTGASQTTTLHRIDEALVKQEAQSAGFVLDGESDLLRHPADDRTARVQESGIRGKTDQFVLKFRKPAS